MADSSASENGTARQKLPMNDLDARQTPTKPLAGWQLREQMKGKNRIASPSMRRPSPRSIPKLSDDIDPALPPAFKAMALAQRKKKLDDFNSLTSVHTTASTRGTENTANASDSDDSDSFDGHDSFASLGDDDDDDEAIREGRNQLARQSVECSRPATPRNHMKNNDFRFKTGVHGAPLDFIAE